MNQEMIDSTLQVAIRAIVARMKEYEAASGLESSDPEREVELQDYFDQLNTAFGELSDIYLNRTKGNPALPPLETLLVNPFPLR